VIAFAAVECGLHLAQQRVHLDRGKARTLVWQTSVPIPFALTERA
jgi:hypothetical protein